MTKLIKEPKTSELNTDRQLINKETQKKPRDASLPRKFQRRSTIFISEWDADQADHSKALAAVVKKESTNLNFKLGLNIAMIASLFIVQLLRGSGQEASVIGVTRCKPVDWLIFGSLIAFSIGMTIMAVCI